MTSNIEQKSALLRDMIRGYGSALIAYSGGVDSALVAVVAHQELATRCLACIGLSPSFPNRERHAAVALAEKIGMAFRFLETRETADPRYASNPADRCYFCKSELYRRLTALAAEGPWRVIADGVHLDDVDDHRHGIRAAGEAAVRSPLLEAGFNKADVRELSRQLGLPVWDKPAMACLSSRVPHGTPITPALLRQIEAAEVAVATLGFTQFRVRHHGEIARLELPLEDLPRALDCREQLLDAIRVAGYRFVTLDLAGFRGGVLSHEEPAPRMVSLSIKRSR